MDTFIDYYRVLGVTRNATKQEIKKAYREKAKQHHPDTGGNKEAFVLIKRAFDTLDDEWERRNYNALYDIYMGQNYYQEDRRDYASVKEKEGGAKNNRENEPDSRHSKQFSSVKKFASWKGVAVTSIFINALLVLSLLYTDPEEETATMELKETLASVISENEELLAHNTALDEELYALHTEYETLVEQYNQAVKTETNTATAAETQDDMNPESEPPSTKHHADEEVSNETNTDFFTLGSTEEHVKTVMGAPSGINNHTGNWRYEYSIVRFKNGKVSGWTDISDNLKVEMKQEKEDVHHFTTGSTQQDVIDVMGTPTGVDSKTNTWEYDYSTIKFENGEVIGWSDVSDNLKLK
ncbi:DnaJ domain-containing protein [Alteribacillus iranensis]|uniref:DnaJ domain-containing protein n=1 Tax=Alteribacillus iranensis TaxID=930128 RepID=A0A1I2D407_9BACI|nr:DnaJ domain-containing protein [Alteribacillus iranensis]SFE75241.1 DnaJ domain-containing protein [Alteribacillus iranensis]